tara:strand:- start:83 stop:286 length:204 start_codon:yes stop_codon:yes gene_type:complete
MLAGILGDKIIENVEAKKRKKKLGAIGAAAKAREDARQQNITGVRTAKKGGKIGNKKKGGAPHNRLY